MIGVIAHENDLAIAAEFFELFKTPWERAVPGGRYGALVVTDGSSRPPEGCEADLLIVYGVEPTRFDGRLKSHALEGEGPREVRWDGGEAFPIYGGLARWKPVDGGAETILEAGGASVGLMTSTAHGRLARIGYDLFAEVRHLLIHGQPESHAPVPTLELHIELLRRILTKAEVSFVEIPPRPADCDFIVCLTHDVDFFGLRRQGIGRTTAGFLYRATLGSLLGLCGGRRTWRQVVRCWNAALRWPLVWLGLGADIWQPFDDYRRVESDRRPTFFLVPRKNDAGAASPRGKAEPGRAVAYDVGDIREEIEDLGDWGCEIGLHGLDAWRDADAARDEKATIERIAGRECRGVRMHWLYFDAESPARLDRAGFDYDATFGYNGAVGFRAGTPQPFRPPGAKRLLELPLIVQDTALFFRDRMGLSEAEAMALCEQVLARVDRHGGVLTLDWHERSLAPERLWDDAYRRFLSAIERRRAHFLTAGEATDWFRWRRSIRFVETATSEGVAIEVSPPSVDLPGGLPGARVLVHRHTGTPEAATEELPFDGRESLRVELVERSEEIGVRSE